MTESRRLCALALAGPPAAAPGLVGAPPAIGALAAPGGVFDSAPGTPAAPPAPFDDSESCWLRTVAPSLFWFGLKFSDVDSDWLKSMSAVTWARTFSAP